MKKPFSTKIKEELIEGVKKLAEETRIPMARLIEEALEDLLNKHGMEVKEN